MSDPTEALARLLALYAQRNPDRKAYRYTTQAKLLLADPGPLLATLAEAGVLEEERAALRPCGCRRPEGDISGCCLRTDVLNAVPERRYVTAWQEADR